MRAAAGGGRRRSRGSGPWIAAAGVVALAISWWFTGPGAAQPAPAPRAAAPSSAAPATAPAPAPAAPQAPATPSGTAGSPAAPEQGPEFGAAAGDESFVESIEVSVVSIDVVVRDRSGNQVAGLTRGDFKLLVDGKPAEITNFYALGGASAGQGAAAPKAAAGAPAAAGAAAPAAEAPKRERLSLVVFVDNINTRPFDRNRVVKQLRPFIEKTLGPDDQLLIVTHDLGLHVRHSFHESLSALGPELDKLEKESGLGLTQDIETEQTLQQIKDLGCSRIDEANSIAQAHAEQILAELKVTYASLHHLLESLGGLEGRKVLLYVGDGVAAQPGTDSYGLIEEMCGNANNRVMLGHPLDGTAPMHQVVATANANLVTLYTLEAAGLRSYARADTGRPIMSADLSQRVSFDRQDSLTTLAKDTGGRAALNANDFSRDLAQIAADINGSYSLGFTPEHAGDGRIHSLKVEVTRPGLTAAYRASYRDRSVQERLEGQVEAALIHGMADNPLAASVKLGTATPSEHGRVTLPIQVRVPFGRLTYLPQPDGRHGRVSIVVGNIDAKGGMSPIRRVQLPLRIPEADAKRVLASNLGYDVKLVLEPGRQRLAFAVRDDIGRVTAAVIQEIDVDKKGTAVAVAQTGGGG